MTDPDRGEATPPQPLEVGEGPSRIEIPSLWMVKHQLAPGISVLNVYRQGC